MQRNITSHVFVQRLVTKKHYQNAFLVTNVAHSLR
jgi:hypothetical protein